MENEDWKMYESAWRYEKQRPDSFRSWLWSFNDGLFQRISTCAGLDGPEWFKHGSQCGSRPAHADQHAARK